MVGSGTSCLRRWYLLGWDLLQWLVGGPSAHSGWYLKWYFYILVGGAYSY